LALEVDGRVLLVRREREHSRARQFGEMLASLFRKDLLDCTSRQGLA
jgi:hypothetical protein